MAQTVLRNHFRYRTGSGVVAWVATAALGFLACAVGSAFETLSTEDQNLFARCRPALADHLCSVGKKETIAACVADREAVFAERPSLKMKRKWLALNGCPATVLDDTSAVQAAKEPEEAKSPAVPEPAPAALALTPPPVAPPATALPLSAEPSPDGSLCQISASCASDLCIRGKCAPLSAVLVSLSAGPPVPEVPVATTEPTLEQTEPGLFDADASGETLAETAVTRTVATPAPMVPLRQRSGRVGAKLRAGRNGQEQIRNSILSHEPEMKMCVERQLKLEPNLRAQGSLVLEVDARGEVSQATVRGPDLQDKPIVLCLRTVAARWRFPSTDRAYAVEAPLRVSGTE